VSLFVSLSPSLPLSLSISFWSCVATETVSDPVAELADGAFICLHPATYLVSQSTSKLFSVIHIDRPQVYLARSWARDLGCAHKNANMHFCKALGSETHEALKQPRATRKQIAAVRISVRRNPIFCVAHSLNPPHPPPYFLPAPLSTLSPLLFLDGRSCMFDNPYHNWQHAFDVTQVAPSPHTPQSVCVCARACVCACVRVCERYICVYNM